MDIVQSSNRVINSFPPLNNITPFTRVDGWSFLEVLEGLRNYIVNTLVPEIDGDFEKITDQLNEWFDAYTKNFDELKTEWQTLFNEFMANIVIELEGLNDQSVSSLIENPNSETGSSLRDVLASSVVMQNTLFYNVKDFGAKGDGSTDDTAAVQAAVDASSGNGGVIWFPPGDYMILGYVLLTDNLRITGSQATLYKGNGKSTYCFFVGLSGANFGYGGGVNNITIENLSFRGDLANNHAISCVSAHRLRGLTVQNCNFIECSINGHVFDLMGCNDVTIAYNRFYGCKPATGRGYTEAIQLDSSSTQGVGFPDSLIAGEVFDGTATKDVRVENNEFLPITVNGVYYRAQSPIGSHSYVDGNAYTGIHFNRNTVIDPVSSASDNYPGILHFVGVSDVEIIGNTIVGSSSVKNSFVRFFSGVNATLLTDVNAVNPTLKPALYPVDIDTAVIADNVISNLSSGNAQVWAYGTASKPASRLEITNNKFISCQIASTDSYLIQMTYGNTLVISRNVSRDCGRGFIYVGNSVQPTVSDNVSNGGGNFPLRAVDCEKISVKGNDFSGHEVRVEFSGCKDVTVNNNTLLFIGLTGNAIALVSPPSPRGFVNIQSNTVQSTVNNPTSSGISLNSYYSRGIVSNNITVNYDNPISTLNSNIIAANNGNFPYGD